MIEIEWLDYAPDDDPVLSHPAVLGWIKCQRTGQAQHAYGKYAQQLGEFLSYFLEMSKLIGDTFALGHLIQGQVTCQNETFIYLAKDAQLTGIIIDNSIRTEHFLALVNAENDT